MSSLYLIIGDEMIKYAVASLGTKSVRTDEMSAPESSHVFET